MKEARCLRCGRCCMLRAHGLVRKCKYLVRLPSGKTLCRIYTDKKRVGRVIGALWGEIFYCQPRKEIGFNYPGCPYNKEGLEMIKDE